MWGQVSWKKLVQSERKLSRVKRKDQTSKRECERWDWVRRTDNLQKVKQKQFTGHIVHIFTGSQWQWEHTKWKIKGAKIYHAKNTNCTKWAQALISNLSMLFLFSVFLKRQKKSKSLQRHSGNLNPAGWLLALNNSTPVQKVYSPHTRGQYRPQIRSNLSLKMGGLFAKTLSPFHLSCN